jgi:hypothetical protein
MSLPEEQSVTEIGMDCVLPPKKTGGLPITYQPSARRAKLAIQAYLLAKKYNAPAEQLDALRANAVIEIDNSNLNNCNGPRKRWASEMLIVPHYDLWDNRSWYCEIKSNTDNLWSLERMPKWAYNGQLEPDIGFMIGKTPYFTAPKSQPH